LRGKGLSARAIAQRTGIGQRTVQRFLAAPSFPERSRRRPQPRGTDAFAPYLRSRWEEGCHNMAQLFREVRAKGYRGCYSGVYQLVRTFPNPADELGAACPGGRRRRAALPARDRPPVPSSRSVAAWLQGQGFASDPALQQRQRSLVEMLCQKVPALGEAGEIARQFLQIIKERRPAELEAWLQRAQQGASKEMRLFVRGLRQDLAAVKNALSLEWSNGPVEGQVNRLKMIKRQMYGRASFYLLRARVLPQAA
jgi:hypothetical protein